MKDLRGVVHREVHRYDVVIISGAEYLLKTHGLIDAEAETRRLLELAELTVTACMPLLPLEGDWEGGYSVSKRIDPTLKALPEEWAEAAHMVAELQREVTKERA